LVKYRCSLKSFASSIEQVANFMLDLVVVMASGEGLMWSTDISGMSAGCTTDSHLLAKAVPGRIMLLYHWFMPICCYF